MEMKSFQETLNKRGSRVVLSYELVCIFEIGDILGTDDDSHMLFTLLLRPAVTSFSLLCDLALSMMDPLRSTFSVVLIVPDRSTISFSSVISERNVTTADIKNVLALKDRAIIFTLSRYNQRNQRKR